MGGDVKRIFVAVSVVLLSAACGKAVPPSPGEDASVEVFGEVDAGTDGGEYEIHERRDAGVVITDSGLPWSWNAIAEIITLPASDGGVTGRWHQVRPTAADRAWAGGVLLFDGGVVGIPFNESSVLVIHPGDGTTDRWPVEGGRVEEGWQGGVLLPDGTVIGIPRNASKFLRIDPVTRTAVPFGDDLSDTGVDGGLDKFRGGVLGLNGLVYAAPATASFIARLNPQTGEVTRLPLPPTVKRGSTQGAVVFPTGDIVMFPLLDLPGLLVIPSHTREADQVWLLPRPAAPGIAPAFIGGGVITGVDTAISPPEQNAMPLRYEAGVFRWQPPVAGVSEQIANAWFFGAWSTNGHVYSPPYGAEDLLSFSLGVDSAVIPFDSEATRFRAVSGAVALPDGRIICLPHDRSAWLELVPEGRRTMPMEAFTSPFLNKL